MKQTSSVPLERPASGPDFLTLIEARDFWRVNAPRLTEKQRSAIGAWIGGKTHSEIAAAEGVHVRKIHERISRGLDRLRQLAGVDRQ